MPYKEEEPEIVCVKDLLKLKLKVPIYQRPYRWTEESVAILFDDLYNAFKARQKEYRIG